LRPVKFCWHGGCERNCSRSSIAPHGLARPSYPGLCTRDTAPRYICIVPSYFTFSIVTHLAKEPPQSLDRVPRQGCLFCFTSPKPCFSSEDIPSPDGQDQRDGHRDALRHTCSRQPNTTKTPNLTYLSIAEEIRSFRPVSLA